jgi:50S ribosomal subunit-associated GTPase HflX
MQGAAPRSATFIGRGKVQSLAAACAEADVDVVICDNELSPAQRGTETAEVRSWTARS